MTKIIYITYEYIAHDKITKYPLFIETKNVFLMLYKGGFLRPKVVDTT